VPWPDAPAFGQRSDVDGLEAELIQELGDGRLVE
jgi:hypothetical protein